MVGLAMTQILPIKFQEHLQVILLLLASFHLLPNPGPVRSLGSGRSPERDKEAEAQLPRASQQEPGQGGRSPRFLPGQLAEI